MVVPEGVSTTGLPPLLKSIDELQLPTKVVPILARTDQRYSPAGSAVVGVHDVVDSDNSEATVAHVRLFLSCSSYRVAPLMGSHVNCGNELNRDPFGETSVTTSED